MTNQAPYPIDFVLTNLNKVRLTAFSVFIITLVYILTGSWIPAAFLVLDFGFRAFNLGHLSLLNGISNIIIDFGYIETLPVNEAPKIFATRIGFIISVAILTVTLIGFTVIAQIVAGIVALSAFLQSVKDFCPGCYIYIQLFSKHKKTNHAQNTTDK